MPQFNYDGINKYGDRVRGILLADSEVDLRIKLRRQNINPKTIKEEKIFDTKIKKLGSDEFLLLIKELSVMLSSGLTTVQAMTVLESTSYTKSIRVLSSRLKAFMEHGNTFSQAVSQYPKLFDEFFLNIVAVGELKGTLANSLKAWIKYKEKEQELNSLTNRSLVFPLIILFSFFVLFSLFVIGFEPVALKLYSQNLPHTISKVFTITKYSIYFSFSVFLLGISVSVPMYIIYGKDKFFAYLQNAFMHIPFFSNLLKTFLLTKSILILKTALSLGFPLKRSLHILANSINYSLLENLFLDAKESASKREPIAPVIAKSGLFPMILSQLISVGEIMGKLNEALDDVYLYLYDKLNKTSKALNNFLEPVLLILGGVLVGILVSMLVIPFFSVV